LISIAVPRDRDPALEGAVESFALPEDVAMYIASSIKLNVRELEGAPIRLAAYASRSKSVLMRVELDRLLHQRAFGPVDRVTAP
jgi:chromosomal replication initiation ATPase DnaA